MIQRHLLPILKQLSKQYPVIVITGPRQSGKTTIVKTAFPDICYRNLEEPDTRQLAAADPRAFINSSPMVIDEIQNLPLLASYIQSAVDAQNKEGMYFLTGSRHFDLMNTVTQSLAGRAAIVKLLPFSMAEIDSAISPMALDDLFLRGFYPRIYDKNLDPSGYYSNYYETYLQRDLQQFISVRDLMGFQKFVQLCSGRIGGLFSASGIANDTGISVPTVNSWLSLLNAAYIAFLLPPYHANITKRLVKSPKLYFHDVGLASFLLGLRNTAQLERDPLRGMVFENLVISECVKHLYNTNQQRDVWFYRDSHGNEVDLLVQDGRNLIPVEIKVSSTFHPDFLKGIKSIRALFPRKIDVAYVVYSGETESEVDGVRLINYRHIPGIFSGR